MRGRVPEAAEATEAVISGTSQEEGGPVRWEWWPQSPVALPSTWGDSALCQPWGPWLGITSGDDTQLTGIHYLLAESDHTFRLQECSGWVLTTASRNHQPSGFCRTWQYLSGWYVSGQWLDVGEVIQSSRGSSIQVQQHCVFAGRKEELRPPCPEQ